MLFFSVFIVLCPLAYGAKFVEQLSKSTISVLHGSRRSSLMRQCSCQEMTDCFESSKNQALDCFDPCWKEIGSLTPKPQLLRHCVDSKKSFIDNLVNCLQTKIKACRPDDSGEDIQVQTYDYNDMIRRVEKVINEQIQSFLLSVTSRPIKQVVDSASAVARCIKTCFIAKNKNGFCFDRIGCQPNIEDKYARMAIRQCSRQISWKKEFADLCKCSANAGVSGISDYCGMLNLMGR